VIADFAAWIERGAADPRTGAAEVATRTIDIEAGRRHWAYQPLTVPPRRPASGNATTSPAEATSPIDHFIEARLDEAGIDPLSQADRVTLARRLSFDLIGLPPTPEEIDRFASDSSPLAYERYVDRLLASPRFGERWGRHWLDVARFAESVTLRGLVQHEVWRYRDYVIDAFNTDLPFNEFLRQQIAGDLLPADALEQDRRQHIATGFLTLTNANLEDQDKEKLRMDVVDEQLSVIGKAILGQTIGCARCHDHKFDPIPTKDYYALAGILRNTKTMEHANVSRWVERPLPLPEEQQQQVEAHQAQVKQLQAQIAALKKMQPTKSKKSVAVASLPGIVLDDTQAELVGQWKLSAFSGTFVGAGYRHDENTGRGEKSAIYRTQLPESGRYDVRISYTTGTNRSTQVEVVLRASEWEESVTLDQRKAPPIDGLFVSLGQHAFAEGEPVEVVISNTGANGHVIIDAVQFLPVELISEQSPAERLAHKQREEDPKQQLKQLEAELKQLEQNAPPQPQYQAVQEEADITDMHINVRGNVHNLGELVPRGFLQVVSVGSPPEIPEDESGRRQLGEWLADADNPLPARVYANRVWHWLFGTGIVATPDNLGTTGQPPSHPELLDYLAGRFIEQNWSTKALVREIVLSQAYRRSSDPSEEHAQIDPENRLLWRMNRKRLEAECLLDAILSVSGEREDLIGGKTVPGDLSADYDFEHDSRRRAVYWPLLRNSVPELLLTFDGANPSLVSGRRNVSSVAPQALYLMNDPWVIEQSRLAARRLLEGEALSDSARIQEAFRRTLGRLPSDAEEQAVRAFLGETERLSKKQRLARWSQMVQSLMASLDFRYVH